MTPGTRAITNSAATIAFGFPTSLVLKSTGKRSTGVPARCLPEKKLPIEVADIYGIHVNDVNVLEAGEREVGKDLASQSSSANHEDLALIPEEFLNLHK